VRIIRPALQRRIATLLLTATIAVAIGAPPAAGASCNHNGFRDVLEQCDGGDLGGYGCLDFCYENGTLACNADCTFNFAGCCRCGNDTIEATCNEVCDTTHLNGHTCQSEGFSEGGPISCNGTCDGFNTNACFVCGNGRKEGPEACDLYDFGGPGLDQCNGPWPEHGGQLACTPGELPSLQYPAGCTIDRYWCWVCGNGRVDPGEACDDHNLIAGDGCSPTCQRECGDGVVERTEECDDGNTAPGDGCDDHCNNELTYFGGNNEVANGFHYDQCVTRWGVEAPFTSTQSAVTQQANGLTISCADNAGTGPNACDRDASPNQCTFLAFYCLKNDPLDGVSCSARNITRVALLSATTLDSSAQTVVLARFSTTMTQLGGAASVGPVALLAGELQAIAPNVPVNTATGIAPMCGALQVVVPRPGTGSASKVLSIKVTDAYSPPRDDVDQLTFTCTP